MGFSYFRFGFQNIVRKRVITDKESKSEKYRQQRKKRERKQHNVKCKNDLVELSYSY